MPAAIQEIGVKKRSDILCSNRAVSDTALHGFNFDQGLKPEKTTRTIAHQIQVDTALVSFRFEGDSDLVCAHRQRSGVIGNENPGHCAASFKISSRTSSKRRGSTRPYKRPSIMIAGDRA